MYRIGWYFQQLLKLYAPEGAAAAVANGGLDGTPLSDPFVVLDADVRLARETVFTKEGKRSTHI